jgi:hypothetical protein
VAAHDIWTPACHWWYIRAMSDEATKVRDSDLGRWVRRRACEMTGDRVLALLGVVLGALGLAYAAPKLRLLLVALAALAVAYCIVGLVLRLLMPKPPSLQLPPGPQEEKILRIAEESMAVVSAYRLDLTSPLGSDYSKTFEAVSELILVYDTHDNALGEYEYAMQRHDLSELLRAIRVNAGEKVGQKPV